MLFPRPRIPTRFRRPAGWVPALAGLFVFCVLCLGGSAPAGAGPLATAVVVHDGSGLLAAGAEVYVNCVYQGTTNGSGQIAVAGLHSGDHIQARLLTYTAPTSKGSHASWAFHVWRTNIRQMSNGSQQDFTVSDPAATQQIYLDLEENQIGFNIVASVEYNATATNLSQIATGLQSASTYLFDASDGQMYFEQVTLYEDRANWDDADFQFYASQWPNADVGGPSGVESTCCHARFPGPAFYTDWTQPTAYRTLIHEFGHYAIGAYDEYFNSSGNSSCTLDRASVPEQDRASIMDYQYDSTEYCYDSTHNAATAQGETLHQSVWATIAANYEATLRIIYTPMLRGGDDPGPYSLSCFDAMTPAVVAVATNACGPISLQATDLSGAPLSGATVTLTHNGYQINEGTTDISGYATLYGVVVGDHVDVTKSNHSGNSYVFWGGGADLTDCSAVTIPMFPWISYVLYPIPRFLVEGPVFHVRIPIPPGPVLPQFLVFAEQGGLNRHQVGLQYNPDLHQYEGDFPVDLGRTLDFNLDVTSYNAQQQAVVQAFHYQGGVFRASGPTDPAYAATRKTGVAAPAGWQLLPADSQGNLEVNAGSLPDNTGVLVGDTNLPAAPPTGMVAVGGPLSIDAENPLSGTASVALRYQVDAYCSLQANSIGVYYYDGTAWTPLTTTLDTVQSVAFAPISQLGIYAVFATPNTTPTFSDVPDSNPFYTYIEFMACHGIVSGYADGTFRWGNNATRAQFSKMVTLAYHWSLQNPTTPTFADVPTSFPFYSVIETAAAQGVISGYACGGPGEPCDPQHRPYFRPYANITRGQIAKILVLAGRFAINTSGGPHFADVPAANPFYSFIETAYNLGLISGYSCGGSGEPCPGLYFRPYANATRGQISKMIYQAVQPR